MQKSQYIGNALKTVKCHVNSGHYFSLPFRKASPQSQEHRQMSCPPCPPSCWFSEAAMKCLTARTEAPACMVGICLNQVGMRGQSEAN